MLSGSMGRPSSHVNTRPASASGPVIGSMNSLCSRSTMAGLGDIAICRRPLRSSVRHRRPFRPSRPGGYA